MRVGGTRGFVYYVVYRTGAMYQLTDAVSLLVVLQGFGARW